MSSRMGLPETTDLLELVNQRYPDWEGFEDPRFVEDERQYKVEASDGAQEFFNLKRVSSLLSTKAYGEIISIAKWVAHNTNLLYLTTPQSGDLAVLENDALSPKAQSELIFDLLFGIGSTRKRLDRYRDTVLGAKLRPSWPLPSYFLFLMDPLREVFVKPSVMKWLIQGPRAIGETQLPGFKYDPTVNGDTYSEIRNFHSVAANILSSLGCPPQDMIDVQSFLWVAYDQDLANRKGEAEPNSADQLDPDDILDAEDDEKHRSYEERVPVHPDKPADEDKLGRWPFANILARRIREIYDNPEGPSTFAVHLHGPWGSGKTSVLNFLREELQESNPAWLIVDFNAWKHQRMRPPWWPLIRETYDQAIEQLSAVNRWRARRTRWWWKFRTSWLPVALTLLTLGLIGAFLFFLHGDASADGEPAFEFKEAVTLLGAILSLGATVYSIHQSVLTGSAKTAQRYLELQNDPLSSLSNLFRKLTVSFRRPLAIFIDDLDRCEDDYVVDLLEGVQTLFREAPVVYVVAADRDWIQTSFERRYTDFLVQADGSGRPLGHLFLQKMFQVSVGLPRLGDKAKQEYWQSLILKGRSSLDVTTQEQMAEEGSEILDDASSPEEIQRVVEEHKNTPEETGVRIAAAQKLSTPEAMEETEHFLLSFVDLLEPNPRAMKRLVNAFGLAQSVNLLSGVDVPLEPLARWTILRQRWPQLADLLTRHPDLVNELNGGKEPADSRIPETLEALFERPAVRRVVSGGEAAEGRLTEEDLRRLAG